MNNHSTGEATLLFIFLLSFPHTHKKKPNKQVKRIDIFPNASLTRVKMEIGIMEMTWFNQHLYVMVCILYSVVCMHETSSNGFAGTEGCAEDVVRYRMECRKRSVYSHITL